VNGGIKFYNEVSHILLPFGCFFLLFPIQNYGDQSGMMGVSYSSYDTPLMCFNPAKQYQLGWFPDRHFVFDSAQSSWTGTLVGVVDASLGNDIMFIKVPNGLGAYYIG
jgi:hypothetical protein